MTSIRSALVQLELDSRFKQSTSDDHPAVSNSQIEGGKMMLSPKQNYSCKMQFIINSNHIGIEESSTTWSRIVIQPSQSRNRMLAQNSAERLMNFCRNHQVHHHTIQQIPSPNQSFAKSLRHSTTSMLCLQNQ